MWFQPTHVTSAAEELVHAFEAKIEGFLQSETRIPPAHVVLAIANAAFHGRAVPARVLKRIDPTAPLREEDRKVLEELSWHVDGEGLDYARTEFRSLGRFRLQFNQIRGFRPLREAVQQDIRLTDPLRKPAKPPSFNDFRDEDFFRFGFAGRGCRFFHNKYPFAPYHSVLVPDVTDDLGQYHRQYLDPDADADLMDAVLDLVFSGCFGSSFRLGYNARGGHASIDHLHWQSFFVGDTWEPPIESLLRSLSTSQPMLLVGDYPLPFTWIPKSDAAGDCLRGKVKDVIERELAGENISFNLYYSPLGVAVFVRKGQSDEEYFNCLKGSPFTTGLAFFEMLSEVICPKHEAYLSCDEAKIAALYRTLWT